MKKLQSFIILVFIVSCEPSQKIEGIWEIDYTINKQSIFQSYGTSLIDFSSDSVSFVQIGDLESGVLDTLIIQKCIYDLKGSIIRIGVSQDSLQITLHSITTDSLTFSYNDSEEIVVAKKLHPLTGGRVNKSDLVGQMFEVLNGEYYHKIDFVNDTLLFDGGYHSFDNWAITTYKEFDFLNTTNWFFPKIPIVKIDDRIIALINTGQDTAAFKPIFAKRIKSALIGTWKEYERSPNPPLPFDYDTLQVLRIIQDSIAATRFNNTSQQLFNLSSDGEFIYFLEKGNNYGNLRAPWKIIKLNTQELEVHIVDKGDTTEIKYRSR
jgi:hypothetical protein